MIFDFLASIFFPRTCAACRTLVRTGALCEQCRATITLSPTLFCGACDAPLATRNGESPCHPAFPFLLGAAGNYETPALRALVHRLKFGGIRSAAEALATFLVTYMEPFVPDYKGAIVVPIPLSPARLRSRGFNQAALIAQKFAAHFGLPVMAEYLVRARHAKPQSETRTLAERRRNIHGCFAVNDPGQVRGKNIILVDDVTTSGTTFLEASHMLKKSGAVTILALAAAKTHRGIMPLWHRSP